MFKKGDKVIITNYPDTINYVGQFGNIESVSPNSKYSYRIRLSSGEIQVFLRSEIVLVTKASKLLYMENKDV